MFWLTGHWTGIGAVCGKTVLLALAALIGLRLAPRRTLAEMKIFDFVAVVAVGAIIGRSATAGDASFVLGFAALVTLLLVHAVLSRLRLFVPLAPVLDHPVRVLVRHGVIDRRQLRICGLTEDDLRAAVRQRGVRSMSEVRFVLFESQGGFTIVRHSDGEGELTAAVVTPGEHEPPVRPDTRMEGPGCG